ncbi:MAG: 4Fe-4S ferredoxin, partial [Actinomycetota bacterium]
CPTDALFYGTFPELLAKRPGVQAVDVFGFGEQLVQTGNAIVVPAGRTEDTIPGGYPAPDASAPS